MIRVNSEIGKIDAYAGAVEGILSAIESPTYKGNFLGHVMSGLRDKFTADSIAANATGAANIAHVFEWSESGRPSTLPLFKITKEGRGSTRYLSYNFLPSTRYVPLPDPARYGFSPDKLQFLTRHKFKFKAIVMETQSKVEISPLGSGKLFIPTTRSPDGYIMTNKSTMVNPGGKSATGGFSQWWSTWFETRAQGYISEQTNLAEEFIKSNGQKIIRDATTGRFASGKKVSIGYASTAKRTAELEMIAASQNYEQEFE